MGTPPPRVLLSEEAVRRFVREVEGAVGYIKASSVGEEDNVIFTIKGDR